MDIEEGGEVSMCGHKIMVLSADFFLMDYTQNLERLQCVI